MCGICGICGTPDREAVEFMMAAMRHRGPDGEGLYEDPAAVLGARRLSIIDVAGGAQPLSNEDGTIQVVFNGEIYNHKEIRAILSKHAFRSMTDGEVISHLYEEYGTCGALDKLEGMFAFALWDAKKRLLFMARDRHGMKPLYYANLGGGIIFASEVRALLASGLVKRELDHEAIGQYLVFQAIPFPLSAVKGISSLPPGDFLTNSNGVTYTTPYWRPPVQGNVFKSEPEAQEEVLQYLDRAVASHLNSERPIAAFLSGGIDSSSMVALASKHAKIKTFSVGFSGVGEEYFSELAWARLVANKFGTEHHEVLLKEQDLIDCLPHIIESMDQPTADGVNTYFVSKAAAEHAIVALSGTGGDELFLGYGRDGEILEDARMLPAATKSMFSGMDQKVVGSISIFREADRDILLAPLGKALFRRKSDFVSDITPDPGKAGDWVSRLEQRSYLSFVLLRDIDAMSMTHSIEVRLPFLDRRFGEITSRIPWQWKLGDGSGKWILKKALRGFLPNETLDRTNKMGFGLPWKLWLKRSLGDVVRDTLEERSVKRYGIMDPVHVTKVLKRFYDGDNSLHRQVWTMFVLQTWVSQILRPTYRS